MDVLLGQVPTVLRSELYAIPALVASSVTVAAIRLDLYGLPAAVVAATLCVSIRLVGVRFGVNAPTAPRRGI